MTTSSLYTPLETFLLFQSLQKLGADPSAFNNISESLKNDEFVQESESFNADRLQPDSLRTLYLALLKEELRNRAPRNDNAAHGEVVPNNPRKRKLSTPPLETLGDAAGHRHLLPEIVSRLYFQYRGHAIKVIEEEERKYRLLHREIYEIERGEWDAESGHQELPRRKDSRGVSSIQTLLRQDSGDVPRVEDVHIKPVSPEQPGGHGTAPTIENLASTPDQTSQDRIDEPASEGTQSHLSNVAPAAGTPPKSPGTVVPEKAPAPEKLLSLTQAASSLENQSAPKIENRTPQEPSDTPSQPNLGSNLPPLQPLHSPSQGVSLASPGLEVNRRLPYLSSQPQTSTLPLPLPSPSSIQTNPSLAPHEPSASPIILPPPPGMLRPSGSPNGPLDALADMAGQQYRVKPTLPSPHLAHLPGGPQHPVQLPPPRNYMQRTYPYYDSQSPYSAPYSPYSQNPPTNPAYHSPNPNGIAPYPVSASGSGQPSIYGSQPQYQSPLAPYPQYHGYGQSPSYYQQPQVPPAYSQSHVPRQAEQRTPLSAAFGRPGLPKLSPINTSTLSTKWKDVSHPGSLRSPHSPTRPAPEEISPISQKAASPTPQASKNRGVPNSQQQQGEHKSVVYSSSNVVNDSGNGKQRKTVQSGRSRGGSSRSRGARAASTTASAINNSAQPRTRSQSVLSHADELSMDASTVTAHKIKPEPPATPAPDEDISIADTTADEGSRKSTRRRRGTLRSLEMTEPPSARASTKRKRGNTPEPPDLPPPSSPSSLTKPNQILGSRNFGRTSATIMNDVTAHRFASLFSKALTEREAPGYKTLIYRGQDLKSIKAAITAGSRALAAAAESMGTPAAEAASPSQGSGTPNSKSATIWVPASADVMPPKGIVNSAQFEKELMRMFANAVMFNPDPKRGFGSFFRAKTSEADDGDDAGVEVGGGGGGEEEGGLVSDTRSMFEAVERAVEHWRAAEFMGGGKSVGKLRAGGEREDGGDEVDELAGGEGEGEREREEGAGLAKRRRR
ncbi:hypothetical protein MMC12_007180 [Toensbergia leucococca]|nr:hypothetical protein [Toensbergia leucococca]